MNPQVKYRIYPSLLDKYQKLVDADEVFEGFGNIDPETGAYKRTYEDIEAELEQSLLDSINRVEREPSETADKGTCFNEVVDCLIERRLSSRDDVSISRGNVVLRREKMPCNIPHQSIEQIVSQEVISASMDGFTFLFDIALCEQAAKYFDGATPQHRCVATLQTAYGTVELYGYADEIVRDKVYDIKTTSRYDFGKFERAWQKDVYPFCLVESGEEANITSFEYTVYVWKGGTAKSPILTAEQYKEEYAYNHEAARIRLKNICERFIEWIEEHREQITDKKIFNELDE